MFALPRVRSLRHRSLASRWQRDCLVFAIIALALPLANAAAQLPAARLTAIYPAGGKAGSDVEVVLTGTDLEGADRLHFSHAGLSATQKTQPVEGQPAPQAVANTFVVKIAAETPVGTYELRAIGTYGISNPRAFVVSDRAEALEVEPNNSFTQATEVPLGATVNGRCDPARDMDYFRFAAKAGERVILDLWGERLDSRLDATLEVYDSNGRQLGIDRDTQRRDPFFELTVPADGNYVAKVYDFQYSGGADCVYRLSIGATPYIDFVLPPAGLAGTKTSFTLFGRNLPGSTPATGVTIAGRQLEQLTVEIELPSTADQLTSDSLVAPRGAFLDGFNYRLPTANGASNPITIGFATAPVVSEQEPNDTPAQANKINLPCEVAAQFAARGDVDWYEFAAKQGEVFRVDVISSRLGLPTDPWFSVEQVTVADGKEQIKEVRAEDDLAENIGGLSFVTASPDAGFRFGAPADGTYRIQLHDLYYETRGEPRLIYRLSLRKESGDFRLVALTEFPNGGPQAPSPWTNLVRQGGTDMLTVLVERRDGFDGPIDLTVEGLPAGVSCAGAVVGPGQSRATLVLNAAETAANWAGTIRVIGKAKIGEQEVTHEARPATILQASTDRPAPARLARDLALAVAGGVAPMLVEATTGPVSLVQGQQLPIALKGTRRGDFKGVINLTALGLPVNVQNDTVALAAEQTDVALNLFVQNNATPGRYTFYVQSTAPVPFTKNADGKDKKDVTVVSASTPVMLTILPGPLVIEPKVPGDGVVKRGTALEIPIKLTRRNNFAGPITLDLLLPPNVAKVQVPAVVVAADANEAKLVIQPAADATEGNHPRVAIRARMEVGGQMVEVHQPIPLNIQP